jgi:hypothetical protein
VIAKASVQGVLVLFRLVSTELLEGDFTLVPTPSRDPELAKRALLEEEQEKHLGR